MIPIGISNYALFTEAEGIHRQQNQVFIVKRILHSSSSRLNHTSHQQVHKRYIVKLSGRVIGSVLRHKVAYDILQVLNA